MAITKEKKDEMVAEYIELLNQSRAFFIAEYAGLNVKQMQALRAEAHKAEGKFMVTKNTLLKYALEQTGRSLPDDMLNGQLATGFAISEAPSMAKALVDFAKDEEFLVIKGGMLGEEFLSQAEVEALAKLPSLDELRGQLVGLISGPARNIASTVASGVRQVVNVIDAYAKKDEAEASA